MFVSAFVIWCCQVGAAQIAPSWCCRNSAAKLAASWARLTKLAASMVHIYQTCSKYGSPSHTWRNSGSLGTSDSSGSITKSGYDVKYVKHAGINEVFCIRLFITCTDGLSWSIIGCGISFSVARKVFKREVLSIVFTISNLL